MRQRSAGGGELGFPDWSVLTPSLKRKGKVPHFRSDEEEQRFWARQSVEEFASGLEDLDVAIRPPRTEQIAVRLYRKDLEALRYLAAANGVGHTTLARSVLEGWLARSRRP